MLLCVALGVALGLGGSAGVRVTSAGPSNARAPKGSNRDKAAEFYETALKLYKQGQYRAAIEKLQAARKLDPTAKELPYNLGLVHEKLAELGDAIHYFQLYLTLETDDGEKERVRGIIKRLEGAQKDLKPAPGTTASASSTASAPPPPPPSASEDDTPRPPAPAAAHHGRLDGWVYGTGAVSVAGLAAGTIFGLLAVTGRPSNPTTGNGTGIADLQAKQDSAHQKAVLADVSFIVAAVAAGAAAVLYFTRDSQAPAVTAGVAPMPGGAAGVVRLRF